MRNALNANRGGRELPRIPPGMMDGSNTYPDVQVICVPCKRCIMVSNALQLFRSSLILPETAGIAGRPFRSHVGGLLGSEQRIAVPSLVSFSILHSSIVLLYLEFGPPTPSSPNPPRLFGIRIFLPGFRIRIPLPGCRTPIMCQLLTWCANTQPPAELLQSILQWRRFGFQSFKENIQRHH